MHCRPRSMLSGGAMRSRGSRNGSEAAQTAAERREDCIRENASRGLDSAGESGFAAMYARRKGEHGAAILESFLCMILIGVMLFGILQLFQLVVADMITEYASFRGARSASVGFRNDLALREALVNAAPASGSMVTPAYSDYAGYNWNRVETEKSLLRGYMQGERTVQYANWNTIHYDVDGNGQKILKFSLEFDNFPLNIPLHELITGRDSITISSQTELTNHSSAFLEK